MKTLLASIIVLTTAFVGMAAGPYINPETVDFRQDWNRIVTIRYDLENAPAVVTVDIQTNAGYNAWISIGDDKFTSISGDVNKVVPQGTGKLITWNPRVDLPPMKIIGNDVARAVLTAWATNAPPDYMVIDLTKNASAGAADNVRYYTSTNALPGGGLANDAYRLSHLVMRRIPAAGVTWRMGSPVGEYNRSANETPHLVTLTKDYYMGIYEFTESQWSCVMNGAATQSMLPKGSVSWNTIRGNSNWPSGGHAVGASSLMGTLRSCTGFDTFDFPTEAQWEYACRAGTETGWPNGQNASDMATLKTFAVVWSTNSGSKYQVGKLLPNDWGLYDMIGNIGEFCLDWFGAYDVSDDVDPKGPATGTARVYRGSYWEYGEFKYFSSARRASRNPVDGVYAFGFRVVCDAVAVR